MRIKKIELCNFGSYEGINTFDTTGASDNKRIIVVGGKNGAGKTTLFTAIQVCLYGHAAFGYKASGKLYLKEIYNLINSMAVLDETQKAYVRIHFVENRIDADEYEIFRSWTWSNGNTTECLTISKNGVSLNDEQSLDFQKYLLHLIPPELLSLYFFDGERIADFFLNDQHNNIKDALLVLSGNDTYEILHGCIRKLLVGAESDVNNISQNYIDQRDAQRKYLSEERELKTRHMDLVTEIEQSETLLREKNSMYSLSGGISIEEWKNLQKQLHSEEEFREKTNAKLKSIAMDQLPFYIVLPLLEQVREQLETERDLKAYQFLRKKLATNSFKNMLCETMEHLGSKTPQIDGDKLTFAIQNHFYSKKMEKSKCLFDLSEDETASVIQTISTARSFEPSIVADYRREIEQSIKRTKETRETLQKSSIENYEEHLSLINELVGNIERLKIQRDYIETQLEQILEKISSVSKSLDITRKTLEEELKKKSVADLSDRMMLLVEELQDKQYQKLLSSVENDLNVKFKQLIRKEGFVDHIYLDDSFELHLIRHQDVDIKSLREMAKRHGAIAVKRNLKKRGYEALIGILETTEEQLSDALDKYPMELISLPIELDHDHFSKGEKQILVMSLYWSLMKQSKNELPFIIDTPFARIDTEHRANITELLFKELQGQLFVLSTNEELRQEHLLALEDQIAKVYLLEYGEEKRTKIIEGSYFEA